jgi:serine O-acetyltransferase
MSPPLILYRIGNFFHRKRIPLMGKMMSYLNRLLFSVWLPSSAKIGKNFTVGYWGLGIVIHSNLVIGDNCQINQNVTLGRNFGDEKVPIIGNDVYIGAGSVVFGEITIGNNVIIGSNSLINRSIPDNCTAVGNPFKIIVYGRKEKYFEMDKLIK